MNTNDNRIAQLTQLGLQYNDAEQAYILLDIYVPMVEIKSMDDVTFDTLVSEINGHIQANPESYKANLPVVAEQPQALDKDMILINESVKVFQNAPSILKNAKDRVVKVNLAAQQWLDKFTANGSKMNQELDDEAKVLLVKINSTVKAMNDERSPITQMLTAVAKQFTGLEAEINPTTVGSKGSFIQGYRNDWAKHLIEETKRIEAENKEKEELEKKKADLLAWIVLTIGQILADYIFNKKANWNKSFNEITLENFEAKEEGIRNASVEFVRSGLGKILTYTIPTIYQALPADEIEKIRVKAHSDYDFDTWVKNHDQQMADLKQSLLDKLPSKKAELQEAKRLADEQTALLEQQRKDQEERNRQMAEANAEEQKRLQAENERIQAEQAKQQELLRQQQEQAEADRKERERQDQEKLEKEKAEADKAAQQQAEIQSASHVAHTLFESTQVLADQGKAPEARTGYDIKVTNPAGWVEIFQFWYQREGVKLSTEDFGKKTMNQMKKFAESAAIKAEKAGKVDMISSKYLVYENEVKAVNRK